MSLSSHPIVKKLEEKLLPEFQEIVERINKTIPNVFANVQSYGVGSESEYQGYNFYISCLFKADILYEADEVADNLALVVSVFNLTTTPKINANVCWGHPSGYSEADFPEYAGDSLNNSLIVSDEVLENLYRNLPRLYKALFRALRRRKPGNK